MYDRQLWYWPERNLNLIVEFFLDGRIEIDVELAEKEASVVIDELSKLDLKNVDEAFPQLGIEFITHLNLPTFTIKGAKQ
jgi:hypothetical protein